MPVTAIGENGRMPPGESWRRAMDKVVELHARGAKRRYRVRGRLVEPGWWAYEAVKISEKPLTLAQEMQAASAKPLTREQVAGLAAQLPRCAQRAKALHGGDSKAAWPSQGLAHRAAEALGQSVYECKLPAPALGRHWHLTTRKKKKRSKTVHW